MSRAARLLADAAPEHPPCSTSVRSWMLVSGGACSAGHGDAADLDERLRQVELGDSYRRPGWIRRGKELGRDPQNRVSLPGVAHVVGVDLDHVCPAESRRRQRGGDVAERPADLVRDIVGLGPVRVLSGVTGQSERVAGPDRSRDVHLVIEGSPVGWDHDHRHHHG